MLETQQSRSLPRDLQKQGIFFVLSLIALCLTAGKGWGYSALRPWDITSTGSPTTVTWGFADDGSWIPANGTSDLVSFLDGTWGIANSGADLTKRPWFSLFQGAFNRWSTLSGLTFVYESADDGASMQTSPGDRGLRADIRIGGKNIDGLSGALASTWLPDTGDIVIDTGDSGLWSNAVTSNLKARNLLMHEIGHGLGLMHVTSSDTALLMESYISMAFDGPQLDDIRGIHSLYGDKFEKTYNGLGNQSIGRSTNLGQLSLGSTLSVGGQAAGDQVVLAGETDFVSISSSNDVDFFSFTVASPGLLNASLTPWGGIFSQGPGPGQETVTNATSANNLSLTIFGPGGAPRLGLASQAGAGGIEVLTNIAIPNAGTYYVRVMGVSDEVQLYELDLAFNAPTSTVAGDFNGDGSVNGSDFILWQRTYGMTGINLVADANGDGKVDAADLGIWKANFEREGVAALRIVPEPGSAILLFLALSIGTNRRWKWNRPLLKSRA
jgi:hypothetical protein